MLIIGSHVSFKKDTQLYGSVCDALSYNANTFMFYTGAPQNTYRYPIDEELTKKAILKMKENGMDISNIIVHAPYIINLANGDEEKYNFSIQFLKDELKRCYSLGTKYLVLHPGSSMKNTVEEGIRNISNALNEALIDSNVTILLETMAGKGTEVGINFNQLKEIIDNVNNKSKIGVCLDTCHLNDSGYDLKDFDNILDEFDKIIGIKYIKCIHINDSKNILSSHKDRHENIGFGTIGFDTLINIIYNDRLDGIPKILETPYVDKIYAPYKYEIEMIKNKKFDKELINKIKN